MLSEPPAVTTKALPGHVDVGPVELNGRLPMLASNVSGSRFRHEVADTINLETQVPSVAARHLKHMIPQFPTPSRLT